MSIEGLLIGLVMLVALIAAAAYPLMQNRRRVIDTRQQQRERLLVFYEQVLSTIRDLDEDLSTGKINQVDYEAERERWAQRGVQVLEALDQLNDGEIQTAPASDTEDAIEAAVAKYRNRKATT